MLDTLWWTNILPWKITIFNGKIHYKWPFSIAFCWFTRGQQCCITHRIEKRWPERTRRAWHICSCPDFLSETRAGEKAETKCAVSCHGNSTDVLDVWMILDHLQLWRHLLHSWSYIYIYTYAFSFHMIIYIYYYTISQAFGHQLWFNWCESGRHRKPGDILAASSVASAAREYSS